MSNANNENVKVHIPMMMKHTVEKIGGTSMSDYTSVRDNIILRGGQNKALYQRIFVVSAYGGVTDKLLEHKKTGQPGIFALFSNSLEDKAWLQALDELVTHLCEVNFSLFGESELLQKANDFIVQRVNCAKAS